MQLRHVLTYFALLLILCTCGRAENSSVTDYIQMEPPRTATPPPPPPAPPAIEKVAEEELFFSDDAEVEVEHQLAGAIAPTEKLNENHFVATKDQPTSTFSIDADGAAYAQLRRTLREGYPVNPGEVRIEELLNYFDFDYPYTDPSHPIALNGEVSNCPWNADNQLVRIGIKGRPLAKNERPAANFVFLIDVSGSMSGRDKLPILKEGFKLFVDELGAEDRVAIVTYAGAAGVALPATSGQQKATIKEAIDELGSGGGTAGAAGIITAYAIAQQHFIPGGNNRIVIGTDGDFNVGPSSHDELIELIEQKRESGIFLTVLGVGQDNYNDHMLEQLANKGNGTMEYIDGPEQLRKVFIYDYPKFFTVAKDVKVQVKFNPERVAAYRLIGYENRVLANEDFEDDGKDAGEIGAGQSITALYEVTPRQAAPAGRPAFTIDFRYKEPDAITSRPMRLAVFDKGISFDQASSHQQFAGAVAAYGMLLRGSEYSGTAKYDDVKNWLLRSGARDDHGFKQELYELVGRSAK